MAIFGNKPISLEEPDLKVHGVTGNYLAVLGKKEIEISIGSFTCNHVVYFVENMADNVFILGRDIMKTIGCIVDYRALELRIGNINIPLMVPHNTAYIKSAQPLLCSKTIIIPPLSEGKIAVYLKNAGKKSRRSFISVTGVAEVTFRKGLEAVSGITNSHRGKTRVYVRNIGSTPVVIYRNQRLGYFQALHACEINSLNVSYAEMRSTQLNGQYNAGGDKVVRQYNADGDNVVRQYDAGGDNAVRQYNAGGDNAVRQYNANGDNAVPQYNARKTVTWNDERLVTTLGYETDPPASTTSGPSRESGMASSFSHKRWVDNIGDLFRILKIDELSHLSDAQLDTVKALISEFRDIFSEGGDDVGCTDIAEQEIILDTDVPIRDRYYNIPLALRPEAEREVKRLLDIGVLEPSNSTYHSPSFLMRKPSGCWGIPPAYGFSQVKSPYY